MARAQISVLAAIAAGFNRARLPADPRLPRLFLLTDPERTPDPLRAAARLPRGAGVIYRHFGAPERLSMARRLARLCRARGLALLIAADPGLAARVDAAGVHLPERCADQGRTIKAKGFLVTVAAHSAKALRAARAADAALLSPVFATQSHPERAPLGARAASAMARRAAVAVIALGGIDARRARALRNGPFAGLAAIGALSPRAHHQNA